MDTCYSLARLLHSYVYCTCKGIISLYYKDVQNISMLCSGFPEVVRGVCILVAWLRW